MNKFKIITLIVLLLVILWYCSKAQNDSDKIYLMNKNYEVQMGLQDLYKTQSAQIVMFGNSLSFNLNWAEALGRNDIINRGIIGDITQGYLKRIDNVIKLHPKICFVEGGINDLYANFDVEDIFENYKELLALLRKNKIVPVVQSTLYISDKKEDFKNKNDQVNELNIKLESYCNSQNLLYINLNSKLSSNKQLKNGYTYDGVHLNADGYKIWISEVQNAINLLE